MPDYTYEPGLALDAVTLEPAANATGVLTETSGGAALATFTLQGLSAGIATNKKGYYPGFKADVPVALLTFGDVALPVVSVEARDSGPEAAAAQAAAEAAATSASEAITAAEAAVTDAEAAKTAAQEAAALVGAPADTAVATLLGIETSATRQALEAVLSGTETIAQFFYAGSVTAGAGTFRAYNDTGQTLTVSKIRASVATAPAGSALVVDVNLDGVTIFTGGTDRPSIAAGASTDTGVPAVTAWPDGSYLTVDVDQVGSTTHGSDLVVTVVGS